MTKIQIKKLSKSVSIPKYETSGSSGMDIAAHIEKNITINKDNQILLNKLVEISSGKWSSVAPVPKKAVKSAPRG